MLHKFMFSTELTFWWLSYPSLQEVIDCHDLVFGQQPKELEYEGGQQLSKQPEHT